MDRPPAMGFVLIIGVALFMVVAVLWADWAILDEVTTGQGRVIPSSQIQVVQNLEGGIIREI
ncbi:MAG: HlyD family type I secretion periplasmic adaptor subunit, partial [Alphaproteobacteria bacterium]